MTLPSSNPGLSVDVNITLNGSYIYLPADVKYRLVCAGCYYHFTALLVATESICASKFISSLERNVSQ